jgi:hypothetical protein
MPTAIGPTPARVAALGGLAALLHGTFDAALYPLRWARPPYLRLEDMPEAFRQLPLVSAPVAVGVAASAVGGLLAVISLLSVEPAAPARRRLLVGLVTGFWAFSALLGWFTWQETPFTSVALALLLGLPRGLAIGLALERLSRPAPPAAGPPPVSGGPA